MPEAANAQIWVSSSFQTAPPGPGGQINETAICTTSAVDPATSLPSAAATDYNPFYASCDVTPSTGTVITSPQCPGGARGLASGSTSTGNPTGQCSITFPLQPGVTYTLNSVHGFYFLPDLPGTVCGTQLPGLYGVCYSDPLGYFSWNITAVINGLYPWAVTPDFPSTNASNTNKEVTCAAEGGVCSAQDFPNDYCLNAGAVDGTPLCLKPFYTPQQWRLATSSAVYGCPTPSITAVSPRTWIAGVSFPITITGTGFNSTATPTCPATTVGMRHNVFWKGNGPVALSNVTIVSPTQITATVTPDPSALPQAIPIGVNVAPNGVTAASSMQVQILGTPAITWTSDPDGTNPVISGPGAALPNPILSNPSAVVGQQIVLATSTPATTLYDGPPVSEAWTVGGTNVAGWAPTTASGPPPTPTVLNTTGLTTYWVSTQGAGPVKYQYCLNIQGANPVLQCTLNATATFAVTGPTGVTVTPSDEAVGISPDQSEMAWGIRFASTATTPSQTPGVFKWVQLVTSENVNFYLRDGTSLVCNLGPGLDTLNPYNSGTTAEDGPSIPLNASWNEIEMTDSTQFQMYLMWDPGTSSSIPVPLGYLPWTISGDAVYNSGLSVWSLNSGNSATHSSSFVTSSTYPTWSKVLSGTITFKTDCQ